MAMLHPPVDPARDNVRGPEHAPITLVEYGDYECPHCGHAHAMIERVREQMGENLRFVFRHFPLSDLHPHASHAAQAAQSAGTQGKFWEMHHALFTHQRHLGDADLAALAAQVGADGAQVTMDLAEGTFAASVRADFDSGVRSGVSGTPTFFINGHRHDDSWDEETLLTSLREAMGNKEPGTGVVRRAE